MKKAALLSGLCIWWRPTGLICRTLLVGDVQVLVQRVDSAFDLFFGDDERRRDHEVADPSLDDDAIGQRLCRDLVDQQRLAAETLSA